MPDEKAMELIARLLSDERLRKSSHFSNKVYADEPIITTGRQMRNFLPDEYRKMREISRWRPGEGAGRGHLLTEAELFYEQAHVMEDFEDSYPYSGSFRSPFPTYSAMSDRQLRGYFSWRTQVRAGNIEQDCLAFAFVYLYELLCGVGVENPRDGFEKIRSFWLAWRKFDPTLDRYVRVWLQDYVVYHDLEPALLNKERSMAFDRALVRLRHAEQAAYAGAKAEACTRTSGRKARRAPVLPLPPNAAAEQELFDALCDLSTFAPGRGRAQSGGSDDVAAPDDLRHVCCAVYARLAEHYARSRKRGLMESLFGEETETSHTMFASAVFFDPHTHADADYVLDEIHRYRCRGGYWTCKRVHGSRQKNERLGQILLATEQRLNRALGAAAEPDQHDEIVPKYLENIIEREIADWLAWKDAHKTRRVEIDLSSLAGIRAAAASTRESLLIDEERTGVAPVEPELKTGTDTGTETEPGREDDPKGPARPISAPSVAGTGADASATHAAASPAARRGESSTPTDEAEHEEAFTSRTDGSAISREVSAFAPPREDGSQRAARPLDGLPTACGVEQAGVTSGETPSKDGSRALADAPAGAVQDGPLDAAQAAYVRALLYNDDAARENAIAASGLTEDMLADAINEALFDQIGDTVLEFTPTGAELIEDYADDVKGLIDHD